MLTKDRLLKDLNMLYAKTGDARFLYITIGLEHGFLTLDEAEGRRIEIQSPGDWLEPDRLD